MESEQGTLHVVPMPSWKLRLARDVETVRRLTAGLAERAAEVPFGRDADDEYVDALRTGTSEFYLDDPAVSEPEGA